MRQCKQCLKELPLQEFPWRNKERKTQHYTCKKCKRAYNKTHYRDNSGYYKAKAHTYDNSARQKRRQYVWDYLSEHPCVDCGEPDPVVLEFDHINPAKKLSNVSSLTSRYSWVFLLAEIAKCEIRCANCHRRKTAEQLGYYGDIRRGGMSMDELLSVLI